MTVADLQTSIRGLVEAVAPHLLDQPGVGPITAAQIYIAWSHPGRWRNEAAFARLAGVAPLEASSGQNTRHRLNRRGDRQLNRALHTIAVTRSRYCPHTQAYIAKRTAEGKTPREAQRCLKRYIARQIYRLPNTPKSTLDKHRSIEYAQGQQLCADVAERLGSLGLELHRDKTKNLYCKDTNRRDEAEHTSFDFLGYTFRGRLARGRRGFFVSFSPAVSPNATKAIGKQISHWHRNRRSATDLAGLARAVNARIRGWFNYYGAFYRLRVVCHRSAHRRTSPPMGDAEVQTIAGPTHQSMEMARRCPSARATTLRTLAPPRLNPTPDCGSPMTGDCHVRF